MVESRVCSATGPRMKTAAGMSRTSITAMPSSQRCNSNFVSCARMSNAMPSPVSGYQASHSASEIVGYGAWAPSPYIALHSTLAAAQHARPAPKASHAPRARGSSRTATRQTTAAPTTIPLCSHVTNSGSGSWKPVSSPIASSATAPPRIHQTHRIRRVKRGADRLGSWASCPCRARRGTAAAAG